MKFQKGRFLFASDARLRRLPDGLRYICVLLFAAEALVCGGPVLAAPLVTWNVQCEAAVSTNSGGDNFCTRAASSSSTPVSVSDSASISAPQTLAYTAGTASASYAAIADYGHLGIGYTASATSQTWSTCGPLGPCSAAESIAYAATQVSFFDEIQITSNTLATGTPVTIAFSFPLDGTLSVDSGPADNLNIPQVSSNLSVDYGFNGLGISTSGCWYSNIPYILYSGCSTDSSILTGTFVAYVGDSFGIDLYLTGTGYVLADAAYSTLFPNAGASIGSVTADFTHTLLAYLTPQDGTVTLISGSGHDYSPLTVNGVPEPATLALLGVGLAGLGFARHRGLSATVT